MDKEEIFSKEYSPHESTESIDKKIFKKEEYIESKIETEKYGLNKPYRKIIRAKVIND